MTSALIADAERTFAVMGTTAHVVVVAGPAEADAQALVHFAVARLRDLHDRWTRFEPTSDVSRLNRDAGAPVAVSRDTLTLLERACDAWRLTDGRFDPTVLDAIRAAGYDRSFDAIAPDAPPPIGTGAPAPGCAGIEIDWDTHTARLPSGVGFDAGGIGKGLAADLVATALLDAGARGACVNVGGDVRVVGEAPGGEGWRVEIEHPLPDHRRIGVARLHDAALVSTWRTKRAWGTPLAPRHHLIDPGTGWPAWTGLAGVCVITARAWIAEALAKASFLAGPDIGPGVLAHHRSAGFLIRDDGAVRAVGGVERLLA